jgi:histone H3/H4
VCLYSRVNQWLIVNRSNPMNVSFNGSPGIPIIDHDQREMSIVNDEEQPMFEDDTFNAILPGSDDDFQMEALPEQDEEAGAEYEQTGGIEVFEDAEDYGGFGGFEEEYETANNGDFYDDDDAQEASSSSKSNPRERKKKAMNISASGNEYPVFPKRVVKKLAQKQGMKISNETLNALMSATDEFFAQASISMGRYARHAGRRTVTDEDANLLLQRYFLLRILLYRYYIPASVLTNQQQTAAD